MTRRARRFWTAARSNPRPRVVGVPDMMAKKRKGSKVHVAVDTLGHLWALKVTAAHEQDRAQVDELVQAVQGVTGENVQLAYVDQGYTGDNRRPTRPNTGSN